MKKLSSLIVILSLSILSSCTSLEEALLIASQTDKPVHTGNTSTSTSAVKTGAVINIIKNTFILPGRTQFLDYTIQTTGNAAIFPIGKSDSNSANVPVSFAIAETETTYELWHQVYTWAIANGYTFANPGREGSDGIIGAKTSSAKKEPVTTVSWRDAMIWCNALTEYYNFNNGKKADLKPVYYSDPNYTILLRTSTNEIRAAYSRKGSQDCPYIYAEKSGNTDMSACTATGFRLPSYIEWEFAARYRGSDKVNTVDGYYNPYYTKGDSASGAKSDAKFYTSASESACLRVAVYDKSNSMPVKTRSSNAIGLYDMSGNVSEWCFDRSGTLYRVRRGGDWHFSGLEIGIAGHGSVYINPDSTLDMGENATGFRIARNR